MILEELVTGTLKFPNAGGHGNELPGPPNKEPIGTELEL